MTTDFPGFLRNEIETITNSLYPSATKSQSPCIFLQGSCGDINPVVAGSTIEGLLSYFSLFQKKLEGLDQELKAVLDSKKSSTIDKNNNNSQHNFGVESIAAGVPLKYDIH